MLTGHYRAGAPSEHGKSVPSVHRPPCTKLEGHACTFLQLANIDCIVLWKGVDVGGSISRSS